MLPDGASVVVGIDLWGPPNLIITEKFHHSPRKKSSIKMQKCVDMMFCASIPQSPRITAVDILAENHNAEEFTASLKRKLSILVQDFAMLLESTLSDAIPATSFMSHVTSMVQK